MNKKILFILKERHYSPAKNSYGLINSANHLALFLEKRGYRCKVITVVDANFIDKELFDFKPNIVIFEALWVPTYKLKELIELERYRNINWIVRVHSNIGYLSIESNGLKLLNEYADLHKKNLTVSANNKDFCYFMSIALKDRLTYLPNVIDLHKNIPNDYLEERGHIDVGCFGALRLLKNQCFQAVCAIEAANQLNKTLRFHITPNLSVENDPILINLKELFKDNRHELVLHDWMSNEEFQKLVAKMDIGLQLSYSESFNIVTSDFINNNRLILVGDAIPWIPKVMRTSTVDYREAIAKIIFAYKRRNSIWIKGLALLQLEAYNIEAKIEWKKFLSKILNR